MTNKERRAVIRAKSLDQPKKGIVVYEAAPGVFYDDAFYLNPYRRTSTFPPDYNNVNVVRISLDKLVTAGTKKTGSQHHNYVQECCCNCNVAREEELSASSQFLIKSQQTSSKNLIEQQFIRKQLENAHTQFRRLEHPPKGSQERVYGSYDSVQKLDDGRTKNSSNQLNGGSKVCQGRRNSLRNGRGDINGSVKNLRGNLRNSSGSRDLLNQEGHASARKVLDNDKETVTLTRVKTMTKLRAMNTLYSTVKSENGIKDPEVETEARILKRSSMRYIGHWYYPEGGWGWIICLAAIIINITTLSLLLSLPFFIADSISAKFRNVSSSITVLLVWSPLCICLSVSPISVHLIAQRPTRIVVLLSIFIMSLGFLFTSFSNQLHQVFISLTLCVGIGMSAITSAPTVILHQYFRKRRSFVETLACSAIGLGVPLIGSFLKFMVKSFGWRLGFQLISASMLVNIPVILLLRPASLYHPQRRAMQHIKYHQKKILGRRFINNDVGFFKQHREYLTNLNILLLLLSVFLASSGFLCPMYLYLQGQLQFSERVEHFLLLFGAFFAVGSCLAGLINSCLNSRGGKATFQIKHAVWMEVCVLGASIIIFSFLQCPQEYKKVVEISFLVLSGVTCGTFWTSLKLLVYSKVRRGDQNRIWALVQSAMSGPILLGAWAFSQFDTNLLTTFSGVSVLLSGIPLLLCNLKHISRKPKKKRRNCVENLKNVGLVISAPIVPEVDVAVIQDDLELADEFGHRNLEQFLYEDFLSSCNKVEDRIQEDELHNAMQKSLSNGNQVPNDLMIQARRFSA